MDNWIEELANDLVELCLESEKIYESYLPLVYDNISESDLLKAYNLLKIINGKEYEEEKSCVEMEQLRRLLGYPTWRLGKAKTDVSKYPEHPFVDQSYIEKKLKK